MRGSWWPLAEQAGKEDKEKANTVQQKGRTSRLGFVKGPIYCKKHAPVRDRRGREAGILYLSIYVLAQQLQVVLRVTKSAVYSAGTQQRGNMVHGGNYQRQHCQTASTHTLYANHCNILALGPRMAAADRKEVPRADPTRAASDHAKVQARSNLPATPVGEDPKRHRAGQRPCPSHGRTTIYPGVYISICPRPPI